MTKFVRRVYFTPSKSITRSAEFFFKKFPGLCVSRCILAYYLGNQCFLSLVPAVEKIAAQAKTRRIPPLAAFFNALPIFVRGTTDPACMEQTTATRDYITAILDGDREMLGQLYRELFPMVRQLARINGGTDTDAEDLFQDALMVVLAKAQRADFQLTSQFSSFLYGIALNLWRSRRKKKSNQEVMIPEGMEYTDGGQPGFDHDQLERQKLFDKAFAQLGPDCRELLLLFFQKTPMSEIARILGFAGDNYARKRKHECKERLLELIKKYPEYRELLNT